MSSMLKDFETLVKKLKDLMAAYPDNPDQVRSEFEKCEESHLVVNVPTKFTTFTNCHSQEEFLENLKELNTEEKKCLQYLLELLVLMGQVDGETEIKEKDFLDLLQKNI